jgi:hypothetical protein
MKSFFLSFLFIFCTCSLFFIGKGVDNLDIAAERYKRALDSGAYAAVSYRAYDEARFLENQGTGFGTGLEDSINIEVDENECLDWFYRLFFRNIGAVSEEKQDEIREYIPMKALILYDKLKIADVNDEWDTYAPSGEKEYLMQYKGKDYKFTLSDQIYDISGGKWVRDVDIGLSGAERKAMVTEYITHELEGFLNSRSNIESGNYYNIVFALNDIEDNKLSGINGVNFIVFCEGLPLPSLNPFKRQKFYAYGIGGSEIHR